jgi:UDP-2,3-diacylglucosamine pyrophosphatase LpxH
MNAIFISDLHLTDRPRDEYRWGIFPWLVEMLNKHPDHFNYIFILGDITENKDYHSSRLINRVVDSVTSTRQLTGVDGIVILPGNHDGRDPDCPYFRFLNLIPKIEFVLEPTLNKYAGMEILLLPHTRDPEGDWKDIDLHAPDMILMHQPMEGAVAETGQKLQGLSHDIFRITHSTILSGDIHSPQKCGKVEYIGAPYHMRFGDMYSPRAVVYENDHRSTDWDIPGPRKHTIDVHAFEDIEVLGGLPERDHVKVRIHLSKAEYVNWDKYVEHVREIAYLQHLELYKVELVKQERPTIKRLGKKTQTQRVDPVVAVRAFGERHKLDETTIEAGVELLPEGENGN